MKRLISLLLVTVLCLCLCACKNASPATTDDAGEASSATGSSIGNTEEISSIPAATEKDAQNEATAGSDAPTESIAATETPATPSETGSAPTEPAPTEPAPTDPTPTEPAPTEPAPTESAPTEPAPTEPAPTEPAVSYKALNTGVWRTQFILPDKSLVTWKLTFSPDGNGNNSSWVSGYGVDIETLPADFRDELKAQAGQVNIPVHDGIAYYIGMGDGGTFSYTEQGKTVTVTDDETGFIITLERTAADQLTVQSFSDPNNFFNDYKLFAGIVFAWEEK